MLMAKKCTSAKRRTIAVGTRSQQLIEPLPLARVVASSCLFWPLFGLAVVISLTFLSANAHANANASDQVRTESEFAQTNISTVTISTSSNFYYPVANEGGYCDNDPSKRPETSGTILHGTLAECCEASFSWMEDKCLSNSLLQQTLTSDPTESSSAKTANQVETVETNDFTTTSIPSVTTELNAHSTSSRYSPNSTAGGPSSFDKVETSESNAAPTVSVNSTATFAPLSVGKEGCQCIDVSSILSSVAERSCQIPQGQVGVQLAIEGSCVPHTYGSSACLRHDALHDHKRCKAVASEQADMPNYCLRQWCYVDATTCRQSSAERVYRSDYFSRDDGVDLFYSYSTCSSADEDWIHYKEDKLFNGFTIVTIVPVYRVPYMYKRIPGGKILESVGAEYYNSSVPYEGVLIDYLDKLRDISGGKFSIDYTFGSLAGRREHNSSLYTAAIQDIADGLADMGVGRFWITAERLKLTSFTVPMYYDRTVLVIPKPDGKDDLMSQTKKVLEPFHWGVWCLILLLVIVTALLSVWFTTESTRGRRMRQNKRPHRLKKSAYARVSLDEILKNGMFFCGAGVEQDSDNSLPQRLLLFGFSFLILIVVSAYVANLAAFLTRPPDFAGTVQAVNEKRKTVCAHVVLATELRVAHPNMNFRFSEGEYEGMIRDYNAGLCHFLAVGKNDILYDIVLSNMFCASGLVITDSLFVEIPVAFPIKSDLASGMSYWKHVAEKNHTITLDSVREDHMQMQQLRQQKKCVLELSSGHLEASDYVQIYPKNFFFSCFYIGCALLAVVLQICHQRSLKKKKRVILGRQSRLRVKRMTEFDTSNLFDCKLDNSEDDQLFACELDNSEDDQEDDECQMSKRILDVSSKKVKFDGFHENNNSYKKWPVRKKNVSTLIVDENASTALGQQDYFHDNSNSRCVDASPDKEYSASSRLEMLVEAGAFDDILDCLQDIKRQKAK